MSAQQLELMHVKFVRTIKREGGLELQEVLLNHSNKAYRTINDGQFDTQASYFNTRFTSYRYFELLLKHDMEELTDGEEGELIGIHAKSYADMAVRVA